MTDPWERNLEKLTARGAETPLRQQVLARVTAELAAPPAARWRRRPGRVVAAAVCLGIAANIALSHAQEARLAALGGVAAAPQRALAGAAGGKARRWPFGEWLQPAHWHLLPPPGQESERINCFLRDLEQDWLHEKPLEKTPEVPASRRDPRRSGGGDPPPRQPRPDGDYRCTA